MSHTNLTQSNLETIRKFAQDPMSLDNKTRTQCEAWIEHDPIAAEILEEEDTLAWSDLFHQTEQRRNAQPPEPVRSKSRLLKIGLVAAVLIGLAAWSHEKNTALALSKQVSSLTAMLTNLETLIQTLGIPNAVRFEESPFRVIGRDQIGLTVLFDKRYVSRIQVRWTQDEPFRTVFEATSTRPDTETISELSKQSGPLSLNGDVIMPELRIETYDDVTDYIPEDKRNQSRRFALTPLGVTADPPALSETPVDVITHDSNAEEPNRYTVHGRLPRNQAGELPARSYLLIYPLLSDECWVSDVIVPAADGRFFVKCYLGTQVDQQRYMLKVISYYGSSKDSPAYKPGERFEKTIDWTEKGFRQFDGGFKTNNGTHGFDIHD